MSECELNLSYTDLITGSLESHYSVTEQALVHRACALLRLHSRENVSIVTDVVQLLVDQKVDSSVLVATLLASLLRTGRVSHHFVREIFGKEFLRLAGLLNCSTSSSICGTVDPEGGRISMHYPPVNIAHRNILLLALLLIDLEQMGEGQKQPNMMKAQEALHVFVPVASRLNLRQVRRRLEDAAFKILEPDCYEEIRCQVPSPQATEDAAILQIMREGIRRFLEKDRIKGEVHGRIKSLYSLHKKIESTGRSIQSIMDRIGLRVVVSSVPECYRVLGILHSRFESIPCCFDDYISIPKKNGYQSLHTCLFPLRNVHYKPVELQIRTELMHHEAEYGAAAHMLYKDQSETDAAAKMSATLQRNDPAAKNTQQSDPDEFIHRLREQMFTDNMVIFGQAGQIIYCPEQLSVREYLLNMKIEVSSKTVIRVNGKAVDISDILHDRDSIEIISSEKSTKEYWMALERGRLNCDDTYPQYHAEQMRSGS